MRETSAGPRWDYNLGLVLAAVGAMILLAKFRVLAYVLKLWPLALILLGWQMYRRAGEGDAGRPES